METVTLSSEQQALFDYIEGSENNIFVTGRAGTGKSTLLTYLIENTKKSRIRVQAMIQPAAAGRFRSTPSCESV